MSTCPVELALDAHMAAQDKAERNWNSAAAQVDRDEVRADIVADIANDPDAFHDFTLESAHQDALVAYGALMTAGAMFGPKTREGIAMECLRIRARHALNEYIDSRFDEYFDAAVRRYLS